MVAMSHQEPGLGAYAIPLEKRQQNMGSIAFPTVSVGDDGQRVVVAFSAVSQTIDEAGNFVDNAVSEDGFQYYRMWGVGSSDGGRNWGAPFVIQDLGEKGTDSASIEYPSAIELAEVNAGSMELYLVYQARRYPGMFTFTGSGDSQTDAGPVTECSQFFQKFTVTPAMFRATSTAGNAEELDDVRAELYPNRATTSTTLELELRARSTIDVSIVDALGRVIATPVTSTTFDGGVHGVHVDVSSLPAGPLHCVVRHDGGVITKRLEIVR
jgi:hypothetical protein